MTRVITVRDAAASGLSWDALQSLRWQRLACGVYARRGAVTPKLRLEAVARRLPAEAAFSGRTAGWAHGLDLEPCHPIEATVPAGNPAAHRAGLVLHKARLEPEEITVVDGLPVTSRMRTVADLGSGPDLVESVVALDLALHGRLLTPSELTALATRARGKGSARLRRAVGLADPAAESPMETRLRLLLVLSGLPKPQSQVALYDRTGSFLGRPDFLYPEARLCLEYDGGSHRESLVEDDQRQNRLVDAGYSILRFTVADLRDPGRIVTLVRAALKAPPRRISPEIRIQGAFRRRISPEIRRAERRAM